MKTLIKITVFGALCFFALSVTAQTYQFKQFSSAEGIHFPFIYALEQDANGYILVGTGEGLYEFDGFKFQSYFEKDGLADNFILSSYSDRQGNIWLGHNSGSVTRYDGKKFLPIDLSIFTSSRINGICGGQNDVIWLASQNDGLIKITEEKKPKSYYKDLKGKLVYDIQYAKDYLLIASDEGIIQAKEKSANDDVLNLEYVDGSPFSVTCLSPMWEDKILVGTEDEGLHIIDVSGDTPSIKPIAEHFKLERTKMADVRFDQAGNIWISSLGKSLVQLLLVDGVYSQLVNYGEDGQISDNVRVSFIDRENNLWIGTFGEGLSKLMDNQFANFRFSGLGKDALEVHAVLAQSDSMFIGTNKNLLLSFDRPNNVIKTYNSSHGLPLDSITGIHLDELKNLWVSTSKNGVFKKPFNDTVFSSLPINSDKLSQLVTAFEGYKNEIVVGTKNGLFIINAVNDSIQSFSNREGLLHNKIQAVYRSKDGTLWIGTEGNGLNYYKDGNMKTSQILDGNKLFTVRSIAEDADGKIWIGTEGDGLIRIGEESIQIDNERGLYSNYCKSTLVDSYGSLWVTHTGGVSKVDLSTMEIEILDQSNGLGLRFSDYCNYEDESGKIWLGSNEGLTKYDHSRDVDNGIEPVLNLISVNISDVEYPTDQEISLANGAYKIKFEFIGISHKKPDQVQYQYILEGYDLEWSELTSDRIAPYNRIDPGDYTFKVRAYNSDGIGGITEKSFKLSIDKPFWQKLWFIALAALAIFTLVRYIVHRREKFLRDNQEMLQDKLEERTKEVVNQKELLEVKNKDITASIEYAKNIQKAMLPAPDSLSGLFSEAFVLFKPRDIVSGDFYWVEKFGTKVIVACADCTGHGVPGAFMSLIAGALLKEVCNMNAVHSPEKILFALDKELKNMVNKNESEFGIDDGMDISIVEFDTETKVLRASGARRPIIIYQNGQRIELKGDRQSIGGSEHDEKSFTVHTLQLTDGDSFYMFSDGFSDQFGGAKGKKLKFKGVIDVIESSHSLSMNDQGASMKTFFKQWIGNYEQIDDVIMLGVRI